MPDRRRYLAVLACASIGAAAALGMLPTAAAADSPTDRFTVYPYQDEFTPAALNGDQPVTVVLQMSGDPVAQVKAHAPGKQLQPGQKEQIERDLDARQEAIRGSVESSGATLVAKYQDAYNGIKVSAPASALPALGSLPNVVAVRPVSVHQLDNTVSVPYIGTPAAWSGVNGVHGEGVKVGIIDTGIDYTHANFGGPGTVAAFNQANAAKQANQLPDPSWFGPGAPKVKGGTDLVGDDYNAGSGDPAKRVPHPGVNPLDCAGHGSHVAGTAAGYGVTSAGATFHGAYDSNTYSANSFAIGPGVAPQADLYAIRVFGCAGSTNVVVDALNWAVAHEMDVVNMSLGSTYGDPSDPDIAATNNAAAAGIVVVASAGNSGTAPYINGSPALAERAISVAAVDSSPAFPGATVALSTGKTVTTLNANGAAIPGGSHPVKVLKDGGGNISLGCSASEYAGTAGKVVVTARGNCARVDRATFGQAAGSAAVIMVNNGPGYPPFEGNIAGVTIPFLGALLSDAATLMAADGGTAGLAATLIANPGFTKVVDFSSSGPTRTTSALKPDLAAPGVSILSTAVGTGNGGTRMSGTSMAAPHVSGVAALTKQAHPGWTVGALRAAMINTAAPAKVGDYSSMRAGTGLVQPASAVATQVVATIGNVDEDQEDLDRSANGGTATALNFGFMESTRDFRGSRRFQLTNFGGPVAFNVAVAPGAGSPHTATVDRSTVRLDEGDQGSLTLRLAVPAATAGNSNSFRQVSGQVVLTPIGGGNHGVALHLDYYLVPRARANVATSLRLSPTTTSATATMRNRGGAITGGADFYAWGLSGTNSQFGDIGIRAVGVQSFPTANLMVFALNTFARWSTPNVLQFSVLVDTNGGTGAGFNPNFLVFAGDIGLFTGQGFSGQYGSAVVNLTTGNGRFRFLAPAPTDGSTVLMPARLSDLGLTAAHPTFTYTATSRNVRNEVTFRDAIPTQAAYNAFHSAISQGQFDAVAPGASATETVTIDPAEQAKTPALGEMIVTLDNRSGAAQAQLVPIRASEPDGGGGGD